MIRVGLEVMTMKEYSTLSWTGASPSDAESNLKEYISIVHTVDKKGT